MRLLAGSPSIHQVGAMYDKSSRICHYDLNRKGLTVFMLDIGYSCDETTNVPMGPWDPWQTPSTPGAAGQVAIDQIRGLNQSLPKCLYISS